MLNKISDGFYKWSKGWLIFILFLLDGLFAGFLLPLVQGMLQGGNERIQPIDLMLFATPAKLFDMIERYGEYGRPFYRNVELTIDILYPLVYLLFFGFLISWLFERGLPPKSPYRKLNVMPLGAWFFDLLENLYIVFLISVYPSQPASLAWITTVMTTLKWLFAAGSILLILMGVFAAVRNGFRKQQ